MSGFTQQEVTTAVFDDIVVGDDMTVAGDLQVVGAINNAPVYAHYTESAGLTISNTAVLRWDTKVEDTHNAVTTGAGWKFTAPSSGVYEVQCLITFAATAITAGQVYGYRGVFVDGSGTNIKALAAEEVEANLTRGSRVHTTFSVRLSTNSYFQIQALASANRAQLNEATFNWIHIRKVSN